MDYVDFEVHIGEGHGLTYPVEILRSPAGEARSEMRFPFDTLNLENRLQALEIALLSTSGGRRRIAAQHERQTQDFGGALFQALFSGDVRNAFEMSRFQARTEGKGVRVKMRFDSAELAALPWEFLYDSGRAEFLCLSTDTPLVRYVELARPVEPLTVTPPLRILAMVASPNDLEEIGVEQEHRRITAATRELVADGLVEVHWLEGSTWRHLQKALRTERWHAFHFVGHGGFDRTHGEGVVMLTDEDGSAKALPAVQLGRLLGDHHTLRLAILNSCDGARGDRLDVFSSTVATLVRRGTPAVVAMQYEISDRAAVELARSFYEALADGLPVDCALAEARKSVCLALPNTLEWGTPVLYMRSPDGVLFNIRKGAPPADRGRGPAPAPPPARTPSVPRSPPPRPAARTAPVAAAAPAQAPAAAATPAPAPAAPMEAAESRPAPPPPPPAPAATATPAGTPALPQGRGAFCRRCGARRVGGAKFCNRCGQPFGSR